MSKDFLGSVNKSLLRLYRQGWIRRRHAVQRVLSASTLVNQRMDAVDAAVNPPIPFRHDVYKRSACDKEGFPLSPDERD